MDKLKAIKEFIPENETERWWVENYNSLSKFISEKTKGGFNTKEERLAVLKDLKQTDLSLMNLYIQALLREDYETCDVAKLLLEERGFTVPN
ncbi:hypothetical protein SAMN05444410_10322 [Hydrobacter penzbergensis]|uniref:Uncharacterized protein n=1 Tax=Hydrobacter penzbergensis TaxID=1235997 RepID=A0A8X8IFH5_9BACT|nr:hypothetical protein [Hydrobacter penzbergensis]SDW46331.1 hypothetical protein SAMN05444410_10322 [Hydrobacter penzbergensis]